MMIRSDNHEMIARNDMPLALSTSASGSFLLRSNRPVHTQVNGPANGCEPRLQQRYPRSSVFTGGVDRSPLQRL